MRNAHKKSWESYNSSKSDTNVNPPWCSSGKVSRRKLVPKCEIQSSYPLRENIWEYLHDGGNFNRAGKRRRKVCKQQEKRGKTKIVGIIFLLLIAGIAYLWGLNAIPSTYNLMEIIRTKLLSIDWKPTVSEECCHKMRYLALELSRAEHNLRQVYTLPWSRDDADLQSVNLSKRREKIVTESNADSRYIENAVATKGSDTLEWGSRVALWGIVPLWKAAPPPDTVLSLRSPRPADCWPFSGSSGELILQLPSTQKVSSISIEHVRPDTAKSAPKHFTIYGTLANNTLVKVMNNQYKRNGPAKQYYALAPKALMSSLIFRVLSNHGNAKYTCIYRIHLYGNGEKRLVL